MTNNPIQREFDTKASVYESNRLANWYRAHAQEILDICPLSIDGDTLDIGCATGYQLRLLRSRNTAFKLVGIDLSTNMISTAKTLSESDEGQFHYVADDWENLTEDSKSFLGACRFRLIICANTLHYFRDPEKAIIDMLNMLESGGTLVVLEREQSGSYLTRLWGFLHRYLIKDHVEFHSANDICKLLKKAGFSKFEIASTIKRYVWKGKLFTSVALIRGEK